MIQTIMSRFRRPAFFFLFSLFLVSCEENQIDIFGDAKIKIVNAASHSRTQQFYFINSIIARDLAYAESTNSYISVKSGDKLVAQFRDQNDGNILASGSVDLQNKGRYTVYLAEDNTGRERIYTFKDDLSAPKKGTVRVKFVHLSGSAPSEVAFYDNAYGVKLGEASRGGQTRYYEAAPASMKIAVRRAGYADPLAVLSTPQLLEGRIYTVVFTSSYNGAYDMLFFRHN